MASFLNSRATGGTNPAGGRLPLMAGNWKMNLDHLQALSYLQRLNWQLQDHRFDRSKCEVVIFPPYTDLRTVQNLVDTDRLPLSYGAQDISPEVSGAFTGEIAGSFLKALGCSYVLVGHSERRQFHGEDNSLVARKAQAAQAADLVPIVCVGESAEEREKFGAAQIVESQLRSVLEVLPPDRPLAVAYEPIWAIGTGRVARPEDVEIVAEHIRGILDDRLGAAAAAARILYGGSVKADNAASFLARPSIDGLLVGSAALDPVEFTSIVEAYKYSTA